MQYTRRTSLTGLPAPAGPKSREILLKLLETHEKFRARYTLLSDGRPYFMPGSRKYFAQLPQLLKEYGEALREDSGLPDPKHNAERIKKALQPY